MSEMTAAPSLVKEPLSSSVMYLDRVRSEMLLRLETIYWQLDYKNLKYKDKLVRYHSMGTLSFVKLRQCSTIILYPNFSCKTSVQCFLVYELKTKNKHSETVLAEEEGDGNYKIQLPAALIENKSNKYLKKSGCIILGIRYNSRRLLNTEVGLYLFRSDERDDFLEAHTKRLFTDFIIHAGGQEFHVHKAILSARSIHFLRNVPNTKTEIVLDAKAMTVNNVIIYLYSGSLPQITFDEMIDIYEVSVILHIQSLWDLCVVYFLDILNTQNARQIKEAAIRTRNLLLIKAADKMILRLPSFM